ncbi:MAG TPA: HWE histidine kinase domain-containing protein [Thermohalobaculum sp.]|nr:HWE histidine kinase domain-containing protein [Thermohalobaculum sp.]
MASGDEGTEAVRRQRAALARFSCQALRTTDLDALLDEAVELVSEATGVKLAKVLELLPEGDTMLVRAGVNWKPGVVGHARLGAHDNSPGGYALRTSEPVISPDLSTEKRFRIPELLREHGISSMVNVIIQGDGPAWGVLEVDSPGGKLFSKDDVDFLQTYANLLAAAIERQQAHRKLEQALGRSEMLLSELRHRVQNLLANVQAMARRTWATSPSHEAFAEAFDDRLSALARTQDLLTRKVGQNVGLRELLHLELEAHGAEVGARVSMEGPEVSLPPDTAQALALALHELATNASKHGALAQGAGHLRVSWTHEDGDEGRPMEIAWRESGVRIESEPERRGFGTEILEQALPQMIRGTCIRIFRPDGLECIIRFPAPEED